MILSGLCSEAASLEVKFAVLERIRALVIGMKKIVNYKISFVLISFKIYLSKRRAYEAYSLFLYPLLYLL